MSDTSTWATSAPGWAAPGVPFAAGPDDVSTDLAALTRAVDGVLAEVPIAGAVVLGVGLNVSTRSDELPHDQATSLLLAGASTTDRDTVLRAVRRA